MSIEYLKIVFSNLDNDEPGWPANPHIIYMKRPIFFVWEQLGVITGVPEYTWEAGDSYFGGAHLKFKYQHTRAIASDILAFLTTETNEEFRDAYYNGNMSGSYIGTYGETWDITHYKNVTDALLLPSAEGGDVSIVFTYDTPTVQLGGEPPDKAQNPTPANDASGINIYTAQLSWEAG